MGGLILILLVRSHSSRLRMSSFPDDPLSNPVPSAPEVMQSSSTDEVIAATLDQVAQLAQANQWATATALCQQLLQQQPNLAQAWHFLGLIALNQGQNQNALGYVERAIALDPAVAVFHNHAGVTQCALGNLEQGIVHYQRALELEPQALDIRYNLALALQKLGRLDEARSAYLQLVMQQPRYVMAHHQLGNLARQDNPQQAIAHYRQALAVDPQFAPAQTALQSLLSVPATPPSAVANPAVTNPTMTGNIIACDADAGFQGWLSQAGGSLVISTYQAGKLALVGWNGQQVTLLLRQFDKPMGIAVQNHRLALATRHQVLLFANSPVLAHDYLENQPGRYDALYLPRVSYFTGDLNIHDLAWGDRDLWIVNTRFSCLAMLSPEFSFVPQWRPSFISQIVPEDRCHLNGLAMRDGKPRYVTALGATDTVGGWRADKAKGGVLIDVETNEIVVSGLSMPHSPYWHRGALWLLNSGAGELLRVNPESGQVEVVCALPGFLRGLCCVGDYALVGLCQIREQHIFGGLPIQERFDRLLCGVAIVDLGTGKQVGWLEFPQGCQELYGVQFLPQQLRPMILNSEKPEMQQAFTAPELAYWLRPSAEITGVS